MRRCITFKGGVLKGRVKRRLEAGETDFVLQNQKRLNISEMHRTREDAERVMAVADAGVKRWKI